MLYVIHSRFNFIILFMIVNVNFQEWSADESVRNDFEKNTVAVGYYGMYIVSTLYPF